MKVLFLYPTPFALPHQGRQNEIVQLRQALTRLGVEVEPLRWQDDRQTGDLLHYFGRIPPDLMSLARNKGMKIVIADSLSRESGFSPLRKWIQRRVIRFLRRTIKHRGAAILTWQAYRQADACVVSTQAAAQLLVYLFEVPEARVKVIGDQDWSKVAVELKTIYEQLLRAG